MKFYVRFTNPTIRNLYFAISFMLFLILIGGLIIHFIEGYGFFESIYMIIITLSTTGYGDVVPRTQIGRIITIALLVLGIGTASYTITIITKIIIEGELYKILGRRKMEKFVERLSNHYIICGYGRIGKTVAEELERRHAKYVVIENDAARYSLLAENNILSVYGDATSDEVLEKAQIETARALITVTRNDADNLFITLSARQFRPDLYIIARTTDETNEEKFHRAGANKVICPYRIGALQIMQAALRPNVIDFIEITTQHKSLEYSLEETRVGENSPISNKTLGEMSLARTTGVIIVGIRREGKMLFNPSADTALKPGDILIALGNSEQHSKLEKLLNP